MNFIETVENYFLFFLTSSRGCPDETEDSRFATVKKFSTLFFLPTIQVFLRNQFKFYAINQFFPLSLFFAHRRARLPKKP